MIEQRARLKHEVQNKEIQTQTATEILNFVEWIPSLGVGAFILNARILEFPSFKPIFCAIFFLNSALEGLKHSFSSFSRSADIILW